MAKPEPEGELAPWDEELIMTLRGPMLLKQFVVYQEDVANPREFTAVSGWDDRSAG